MEPTRRIVLTGGPGAGKTTLLDELARRGFRIVPEAARAVLRQEGGLHLRANDPDGFADAILQCELKRFTMGVGGTHFFDRGLGDLAAMPVSDTDLRTRIANSLAIHCYDNPVFRAPAWREIYCQDRERTQSWEEAVASDKAVTAAWRASGYDVVDLPLTTPEDRADFVLRLL